MSLEKIVSFARDLKRNKYPAGTTKGACLQAANELYEHFREQGLNCSIQFGFYQNKDHAWFEYWDENLQSQVIIDITADQFDPALDVIAGTPSNLMQYVYADD